MKRIAVLIGLLFIVVLMGIVPGCSCSNDTSSNPGSQGSSGTEGKAQALVFSTPT